MKNFIPIIKYILITIKHKYFVFKIGLELDVPLWRLIKHDISKFYPSELPHYARQFYGKANDPEGFSLCWLKHQNRNDHHWEYWVSRYQETNKMIPMSNNSIREMVADWLAACRVYEGKLPKTLEDWKWHRDNFYFIYIHTKTRSYLNSILLEWFREGGVKNGEDKEFQERD